MIHSLDIDKRRGQWRRTIPGLIGQQCYLVFASELGIQCHGRLAGLTAVGLSALVAESLPDQFRGPLPAICIVDDDLRSGKYSPEGAAVVFDAIVLHELAHVVAGNITPEVCPVSDQESLRDLVATDCLEWPAHAGSLRWLGHEARFIRALCHLHYRLNSKRQWTSLSLSFSHKSYGLSSAERYLKALGDELQRYDWLTLQEVLNRPMPEAFSKLWTADVLRSVKSVRSRKEQV